MLLHLPLATCHICPLRRLHRECQTNLNAKLLRDYLCFRCGHVQPVGVHLQNCCQAYLFGVDEGAVASLPRATCVAEGLADVGLVAPLPPCGCTCTPQHAGLEKCKYCDATYIVLGGLDMIQ